MEASRFNSQATCRWDQTCIHCPSFCSVCVGLVQSSFGFQVRRTMDLWVTDTEGSMGRRCGGLMVTPRREGLSPVYWGPPSHFCLPRRMLGQTVRAQVFLRAGRGAAGTAGCLQGLACSISESHKAQVIWSFCDVCHRVGNCDIKILFVYFKSDISVARCLDILFQNAVKALFHMPFHQSAQVRLNICYWFVPLTPTAFHGHA